jgi:uncharacterized protein YdaU (DUF1376 family)
VSFLKWYKRDPRAALVGMAGLTFEERGAYNTILDLLYCHDGALVDDSIELARLMNTDVRIWKRLRIRLLEARKIYLSTDGTIRNERTDVELTSAEHRANIYAELRTRRRNYNRLAPNNYNHIEREKEGLAKVDQGLSIVLDKLGKAVKGRR